MSAEFPRFVVELGEIGDGLKRVPLAKLGRYVKGTQKFSITPAVLAEMVANVRKRAAETVVDYDHASEFPEIAQGQPIPAAGWLKAIDDAAGADGVLWGQVEFTPRARQMVDAKEYRYISPVINFGARDKETGEPQGATLASIALTNRPFLDSMPAIAMSDRAWQEEINRGDAGDESQTKGVRIVKLILADRVARTVRVVGDDNTESVLVVEGLDAPEKVIRLSDVKRTTEGLYDFAAVQADGETLVAGEVFRAHRVQGELDSAVAKGLITPAQRPMFEKMALSDLIGFRDLVKTMKPVVDLTERGIGGSGEGGEGMTELQRLDAEIDRKAKAKIAADASMPYHTALKLVASEHPDLDRKRTQLTRPQGGDR